MKTVEPDTESLEAELKSVRDRLIAVQDISEALAGPLELDMLLGLVMEKVTELMRAERSTLFLLDADTGVLTSRVAQTSTQKPLTITLELGEGIAGWVAMTGRTINMKDAYKDPRFQSDVDVETGFRTRSMLCKPMWNIQGTTIGVFQVLNKGNGYFTQEDEELLSALASQAALSIENARLYVSLQARNIELNEAKEKLVKKMEDREVLLAIEQTVSSQFHLDEVLDRVLEEIMESIPSKAGSILLLDKETNDLTFRSYAGSNMPELHHRTLPKGKGLVGWCAENGESILSNDVQEDSRHAHKIASELGIEVDTAVCVPIFSQENSIGALQLLNSMKKGRRYDGDDLQLLTLISGQISRAIDGARARDEHLNENRLAAIGQSLSGVLHDFRTPMTVISGYIQLMEGEEAPEERAEYGEIVKSQISHLNTMVREVLAYARGEITLFIKKQFLADFFKELIEAIRVELEAKGVEVHYQEEDRGYAFFDASKLRRTIFNLARNAREAMEGQQNKGKLHIRVWGDVKTWSVSVADNGHGIPERIRDTLFDDFVTYGKQNGTGLGLAIVKKVVEEHGGNIEVESILDEGSTFTITLPRQPKDEETSDATS